MAAVPNEYMEPSIHYTGTSHESKETYSEDYATIPIQQDTHAEHQTLFKEKTPASGPRLKGDFNTKRRQHKPSMNSKLKIRIATFIIVSLIICLSIISTMFGLQRDGYNEQKQQLIRLQNITDDQKQSLEENANRFKNVTKNNEDLKKRVNRLSSLSVSIHKISTRGKSTYVLLPISTNWDYAQVLCSDIGGSLAEIETEEEFTSLNYTLRVVKKLKADLWIGGTDKDREGVWKWASSNTPIKLTFWRLGEPNNSQNNEHCLEMQLHNGYLWNDKNCGSDLRFLCEILQNNN
ncbi:collectin-11-like [Saccostrea cucullata]|uniref:collectin-11-like n=1 Tax=Saccostrea cuccullata TaxID=36930 RepID=UPI002ED08C15